MRSILKTFILLVTLTISANANAQILLESMAIVDIQKIITQSKASNDIKTQIDNKTKEYQKNIARKEEDLRKSKQKLVDQRALLSPEAFEDKSKAFKNKLAATQRDFIQERSKIDKALKDAMRVVQNQVVEIIQEISKQKGLTIVLSANQVLFANTKLDITSKVLSELDNRLPKVAVKVGK